MSQVSGGETPKKKSGILKWVLLGCGGLLVVGVAVVGVIGYLAYRSFNMDPAEAESVAQSILPLEIPSGFRGRVSISTMGMRMATLDAPSDGGRNSRSSIVLIEMQGGRSNQNQDAMRQEILDRLAREGNYEAYLNRRPDETFRLRNMDIQAQVKERGNQSGSLQYTFVLEGKNGKVVMLMVGGDEKLVTHEWVQGLLDTVK